MAKITNLKNKLHAWSQHPEIWAVCDETGKPVSELGYFRCDHDGYLWHNTVWPVHDNLYTRELGSEFDAVLDAFRRAFRDRIDMSRWCARNAGKTGAYDEYNAFYDGNYGYYWFRMITRRGDYNLYLHCYSKSAM